jgi:hypothetical protein
MPCVFISPPSHKILSQTKNNAKNPQKKAASVADQLETVVPLSGAHNHHLLCHHWPMHGPYNWPHPEAFGPTAGIQQTAGGEQTIEHNFDCTGKSQIKHGKLPNICNISQFLTHN